MDWRLEVVTVPVSDVDRALHFYKGQMGFDLDLDTKIGDAIRLVQLTPPGSSCSIHIGTGITEAAPGSLWGLILVVADIEQARSTLVGRGVEVTPVRHFEEGEWVDGSGNGWNAYVFFGDPDGNGWMLQESRETSQADASEVRPAEPRLILRDRFPVMDLDRLTGYCLTKPGSTAERPFGPGALVMKVGGKMFAIVMEGEDRSRSASSASRSSPRCFAIRSLMSVPATT